MLNLNQPISRLEKTGAESILEFIETPTPKQITKEDGERCYVVDGEPYPSITTIMSWYKKDVLDKWRKRVGEEEANRISTYASNIGTPLHDLCEHYLRNDSVYHENVTIWKLFKKIEPTLRNINNIKILEGKLLSRKLKVAGTTDCLAFYKGILSVIDFKTSGKIKKEEWIDSYFMQTCFYAMCYYELTGILPKQLVIMIAGDYYPQIFVKKTVDWIEPTVKVIKDYHRTHDVRAIFEGFLE